MNMTFLVVVCPFKKNLNFIFCNKKAPENLIINNLSSRILFPTNAYFISLM